MNNIDEKGGVNGESGLAPALDDAWVAAFRERFRGEVIAPGDDAYDEARRVWNGMVDRRPALVVRPTGTADVVRAVEFARDEGLELAVRGGGHNVAGTAVCDGGLVVDLSAMNGVRVDPASRTVRVGGGATLGDVDHETQLFGLATALGAVSKTGVAGLTLNGGYGHLSREFGLALDSLVSADVVTADGRVRTASAEENSDLFWALRGGGGNFGVVTSFEFALYEVGPEVYAFFPWFRVDDVDEVMDAFREWATSAPRNAGVLPVFAHIPEFEAFPESAWGDPAVAFLGSFRGDVSDAADAFRPLRERATPIVDLSGPMPFEDLQRLLDEDYPDGMRYYWKSVFLTDATDEVVDLAVRYNESSPSPLSTIDIWHLGGAVADVPQDATAFWHRDKPFMLTVEANWVDPDDDEANAAWARELFAEVTSLPVASGRYANFPGMGEDPATLLFGDNYDRLVDLKTKCDPTNLFRRNQNVAPRTTEGPTSDEDDRESDEDVDEGGETGVGETDDDADDTDDVEPVAGAP